MTTLEQFRIEQQAQYKIQHEKEMDKYPWIRETINAYRNATPEQIEQVQKLLKKRNLI